MRTCCFLIDHEVSHLALTHLEYLARCIRWGPRVYKALHFSRPLPLKPYST
jgi:hypothetical protein